MNFTWNPEKHLANLNRHGLDFASAEAVFSGHTFTKPDKRFAYGEARFSTMGLLGETVVVIAHTETEDEIHVIYMNVMNEKTTLPALDELDEAPVWTAEDFAGAVHRVGLEPVGKKLKINITLDPDVVAWYKAKAGGRGYQTLMNAALRDTMRGQQIADTLRQIIREELHA
jgi:uncharacterized DUF497 family protein/uncharacterized protein (DUF4415 family)